MRVAKDRAKAINESLEVLNKVREGKITQIKEAEQRVVRLLPDKGIYLGYDDYTNRWILTNLYGEELYICKDGTVGIETCWWGN